MARSQKTDLLRGTLDLLILRTLALGAMHGVAIADRIAQITRGTFVVQAGSHFPALHRLERERVIEGDWTTSDEGRRVKSYTITATGRRRLTSEQNEWARIVAAVSQVLRAV